MGLSQQRFELRILRVCWFVLCHPTEGKPHFASGNSPHPVQPQKNINRGGLAPAVLAFGAKPAPQF